MTYLEPYISKLMQGQIWKLEIDPLEDMLFAESRDTENKQALFYGFDLDTGDVCFTGLTQPEKWLTGIEGSYKGILFLHGYQSAQSPIHKGITAVEGKTGDVLWSNYTYAVHHISTNGPIAFNTQIQPPKLFLLDAQNGAALRAYNPLLDEDVDTGIRVPFVIESLDDEFKSYIEGDIMGNIHYMEYNSFRIVSLHSLIKDVLSQVLLIIAGSDLVYHDLLNDKIQKLQPEAFMMHRNRLVYIKDKAELKVLNL